MIPERRTYDEWKAMGYVVKKGEKSTARDKDGKCTFLLTQVKRRSVGWRNTGDPGDEEFDQDDYDMWYDMYGCDRDWA